MIEQDIKTEPSVPDKNVPIYRKEYTSLVEGKPECFIDDMFTVEIKEDGIYVSSYSGPGEPEYYETFKVDVPNIELDTFTKWMLKRYGRMPDDIWGLFKLKNGKAAIMDHWC